MEYKIRIYHQTLFLPVEYTIACKLVFCLVVCFILGIILLVSIEYLKLGAYDKRDNIESERHGTDCHLNVFSISFVTFR